MASDTPFQVIWSPQARASLLGHVVRLQTQKVRSALAQLIMELESRLETNPLELGEVYLARGAILELAAVKGVVTLDFAVDTERHLVHVRKCLIQVASE